MFEVLGYLVCGALIGAASVLAGRMTALQATQTVGAGVIGLLLISLTPHLGAPQDEVRAALEAQGQIALWFFLALLAATCYIGLQILDPETPSELRPRLRRLEGAVATVGGLLLLLALAATKITLAA